MLESVGVAARAVAVTDASIVPVGASLDVGDCDKEGDDEDESVEKAE